MYLIKKWRARKACNICLKITLSISARRIFLPKAPGVVRVLALDDATKDTGWALYDNEQLVDFGVARMGGDDTIARIALLRQWVLGVIDSWKPDKIAIEDIQLQSYYNAKTNKSSQNVVLFKTRALARRATCYLL